MRIFKKLETVARELGVDPGWLRELVEQGEVPGVRHRDTFLMVPLVTESHIQRLAATRFERVSNRTRGSGEVSHA